MNTKHINAITKNARSITDDMIIEALKATGGIKTAAVALIKKNTGISMDRTTINLRLKKNAKIQEAIAEAEESVLDLAQGSLVKAIKNGNITAIIFYLKTKGKDRGFVEKHEIDSKTEITNNPFANLTTEELRKLADGK